MPPPVATAPHDPPPSDQKLHRQLLRRFGKTILKDGFSCIPNLLLRHQATLGITPVEMNIITHIWTCWWYEWPFPRVRTIAERIGRTKRAVQYHLHALKTPQVV